MSMGKSISQRAVDFAGDRSQGGGHGFPSWEASLIAKGYEKGAKDQQKLMYSEKEVKNIAYEFHKKFAFTNAIKWDWFFEQFKKK